MLTVAYLANQLPSAVEPYVVEEIEELRRRGVRVVAGSVRRPLTRGGNAEDQDPQIVLEGVDVTALASAVGCCVRKWALLAPLMKRILFRGREGFAQRIKALVHIFLGAYYAALLKGRGVEHIHVHHGYFGSWIAMTAARLMGVGFSMTLHGSDLLLHGAYLDTKLAHCTFCVTISEYNRNYILQRYAGVDPRKVLVVRLGVDVSPPAPGAGSTERNDGDAFRMLAVGRLHAVKDHAFLVQACSELAARGLHFQCEIAGEGPERKRLEKLISSYGLRGCVRLLGHVRREEMNDLYDRADLVVLTSRSEGIPLVLMEAMARGKIVLAPAITGIPELITPGDTGFLYQPGSARDFVGHMLLIYSLGQPPLAEKLAAMPTETPTQRVGRERHFRPADFGLSPLERIGRTARNRVCREFNSKINLGRFAEEMIERAKPGSEKPEATKSRNEHSAHENPVLQQVQLSLQRDRSLPV